MIIIMHRVCPFCSGVNLRAAAICADCGRALPNAQYPIPGNVPTLGAAPIRSAALGVESAPTSRVTQDKLVPAAAMFLFVLGAFQVSTFFGLLAMGIAVFIFTQILGRDQKVNAATSDESKSGSTFLKLVGYMLAVVVVLPVIGFVALFLFCMVAKK